jgi:hypothetical protein
MWEKLARYWSRIVNGAQIPLEKNATSLVAPQDATFVVSLDSALCQKIR